MISRSRKSSTEPVIIYTSEVTGRELLDKLSVDRVSTFDYLKFVFFSALLLIPVYAIIKSAISHDWLMMVVDAVLIPVGLVHGLLMLTGIIG